jgi:CRP/FNR family cyclic AMP-dependent transcriptional regulator
LILESTFWYLEQNELVSLLSTNELEEMALPYPKIQIAKGEPIFSKKTDQIFYIIKGKVVVGAYNDQGLAAPIIILKPDDIVWKSNTNDNIENRGYALASIETLGCFIPIEDFKNKLKDPKIFTALVMKMMGAKVSDMERRLESLIFKDSRTRIIDFIIQAVNKRGQRIGYEYVVRNFSTHQEVADMTATSRQTVTMILNDLRNENIISFDRKRLLVRDFEKLKSVIS